MEEGMVASSIAKIKVLGMRKQYERDEIPLGSINKFGTGSKSRHLPSNLPKFLKHTDTNQNGYISKAIILGNTK
jgi:hypothetical protein